MSHRKTIEQIVDITDAPPAILRHLEILLRQRERSNRLLLKRRRAKSGQ